MGYVLRLSGRELRVGQSLRVGRDASYLAKLYIRYRSPEIGQTYSVWESMSDLTFVVVALGDQLSPPRGAMRPKQANLSLEPGFGAALAKVRHADYTSLCFAKRRAIFQYESHSAPQLILDQRIGLLTMRLDGPVTPDMVCALVSAGASSL